MTYTQVKGMVNLNLCIKHHYKYIVSIIRVKFILTLHLSTANWRILTTTGCCCKNAAALHCTHYVILPGRVNTTVTRVVAYYQCTYEWDLILLYFKEMLPHTVSSGCTIFSSVGKLSFIKSVNQGKFSITTILNPFFAIHTRLTLSF